MASVCSCATPSLLCICMRAYSGFSVRALHAIMYNWLHGGHGGGECLDDFLRALRGLRFHHDACSVSNAPRAVKGKPQCSLLGATCVHGVLRQSSPNLCLKSCSVHLACGFLIEMKGYHGSFRSCRKCCARSQLWMSRRQSSHHCGACRSSDHGSGRHKPPTSFRYKTASSPFQAPGLPLQPGPFPVLWFLFRTFPFPVTCLTHTGLHIAYLPLQRPAALP